MTISPGRRPDGREPVELPRSAARRHADYVHDEAALDYMRAVPWLKYLIRGLSRPSTEAEFTRSGRPGRRISTAWSIGALKVTRIQIYRHRRALRAAFRRMGYCVR